MSTGCQRTWFCSQDQHGGSWPSVTPVSEGKKSPSGLWRHQTHCGIQIYIQTIHININKSEHAHTPSCQQPWAVLSVYVFLQMASFSLCRPGWPQTCAWELITIFKCFLLRLVNIGKYSTFSYKDSKWKVCQLKASWWPTPGLPAVESLRQKDHEFKASSLEGGGKRGTSYLLENKAKSTDFSLVVFSYLTICFLPWFVKIKLMVNG